MNKHQQYRVYYIPAADREQFNKHRDDKGLTNAKLIASAVDSHLSNIVTELERLGFSKDEDRKAVRWPVTDEALADLKLASERVGIPAAALLLLALRMETAKAEKPARKPAKKPVTARAAKRAPRKTKAA